MLLIEEIPTIKSIVVILKSQQERTHCVTDYEPLIEKAMKSVNILKRQTNKGRTGFMLGAMGFLVFCDFLTLLRRSQGSVGATPNLTTDNS